MHSQNAQNARVRFRGKRTVRRFLLLSAMLALVVQPSAGQVPGRSAKPRGPIRDDNDPRVKAAVSRAAAFLRNRGADGGVGELALVVHALAKIHQKFPDVVVEDDPSYQRMVDDLVERCRGGFRPSQRGGRDNYEAGCAAMALAAAGGERYAEEIGYVTQYILSKQLPNGSWSYTGVPTGDNSMTQYAILGLWDGSIYGDFRIPRKVWDDAAYWLVTRQDPQSGGFTYHPADPGTRARQPTSYHTMTVAGLGSLYICRDHLPGGRRRSTRGVIIPVSEVDEDTNYKPQVTAEMLAASLMKGAGWFNSRFTVEQPTGNGDPGGRRWLYYYLYALERYGTLAGLRTIAGVDWYSKGAGLILLRQRGDGAWQLGNADVVDTSFAVLFLVRSTRQTIHKHLRRLGRGTLVGARGLPRDLSKLVQVRGKLKAAAIRGSTGKLLGLIESDDLAQAQGAAAGLLEQMYERKWKAVGEEGDRLRKMTESHLPEVRAAGLKLLAQTDDYRVVPLLIRGMYDEDGSVQLAAQEALCKISRKLGGFGWYADPTDEKWRQEIEHWKRWYRRVRPEAELEDEIEW